MTAKAKRKASALNTRRSMKQALALSEKLTAALVDALTEVEVGDGTELAVAVGALRSIVNHPTSQYHKNHEHAEATMRGIARVALHKLNLPERNPS